MILTPEFVLDIMASIEVEVPEYIMINPSYEDYCGVLKERWDILKQRIENLKGGVIGEYYNKRTYSR